MPSHQERVKANYEFCSPITLAPGYHDKHMWYYEGADGYWHCEFCPVIHKELPGTSGLCLPQKPLS